MGSGQRRHSGPFPCGGSLIVGLYAWSQSTDDTLIGDLTMLAAIILCGPRYADGAVLSRRLGGWQVISWALALAVPAMVIVAAITRPGDWSRATVPVWMGLAYLTVFSMLICIVCWYRGLAHGGIAAVGQLQLLQPFSGLILAGVLLCEPG
ncbi:EamA family transporter [Paracoccus sp. Ld10]|uniref:EamA family transporter n=1 Tax=Paracoccus sp. Ld10 TaxID=649158 RepID=UPI0038659632